jgi:hypothetical protein
MKFFGYREHIPPRAALLTGAIASASILADKQSSSRLYLLALLSTLMLAWILYTQIVVIQHHWARLRRPVAERAPGDDEPAPTVG